MHPPRLHRLPTLFTDRPLYFLTTCVSDRRSALANRDLFETFRQFASQASDRGVLVGRFVIMPDHLHLFAAFSPASPPLGEWMKALKRSLAGYGKTPFQWQKGFFDHVLRSQESYSQKWEYVRQNPMRAGLVQRAEDWPYQGEIHRLTL